MTRTTYRVVLLKAAELEIELNDMARKGWRVVAVLGQSARGTKLLLEWVA